MVLHPPPLSYACIVFLPFINNRNRITKVSRTFSIVMFWIENLVLFILFFLYEMILIPFAFLKTLFNILFSVDSGILRKIGLLFFWIVAGLVISGTMIYRDFKDLAFILSNLNGFSDELQKQEENLNIQTKIEILNLVRDSVIILFKTLKNHFRNNQ